MMNTNQVSYEQGVLFYTSDIQKFTICYSVKLIDRLMLTKMNTGSWVICLTNWISLFPKCNLKILFWA